MPKRKSSIPNSRRNKRLSYNDLILDNQNEDFSEENESEENESEVESSNYDLDEESLESEYEFQEDESEVELSNYDLDEMSLEENAIHDNLSDESSSDGEQTLYSLNYNQNAADKFDIYNDYYEDKDGNKWNKEPQIKKSRTRNLNIGDYTIGPVDKHLKEENEIFNHFFDDNLIKKLVDYTNKFINSIKIKSKHKRKFKETNMNEMRSFFGLLILFGVSGIKSKCKSC